MESPEEIRSTRRLRMLARFGGIWALIILLKLGYYHIYLHEELRKKAEAQSSGIREIPAPRGRIYDRGGQTLAISVPADSVAINPRLTPDIDMACDLLAPLLSLDSAELQEKVGAAAEKKRGFLWIKKRISLEEAEKLRSLKLDWIELSRDSFRHYPKGSLASNVIGSVNHEGTGNFGLELSLNRELSGKPGQAKRLVDAQGRPIESRTLLEPRPGQDIGLSIDERIQFMADRELAAAVKLNNCQTGTAVVLNPRTGEILAMSNWPTFDPNGQADGHQTLLGRQNRAISAPFEPGSVFKIITLATALETTRLRPNSLIDCGPGVMTLFGRRIHDLHAYNTIPMQTVLAKSSNIGAIRIGLQVGEPRLYEYITRFGFGARTGIPLPFESPGKVRTLKQWQTTSIGSIAMGHEISATALQLAMAASAIANDGILPKPRLILWRQERGGSRKEEPVEPGRRVIQPTTSVTMRQMMEHVVLDGTGKGARLIGYTSGGKTGSAQIFDPGIRRYTHRYNASFAGFAPIQTPAVVVAVTLNGATKYGGLVAAPVFQKIATEALRILGAIPDMPLAPPEREVGLKEEEMADLPDASLTAEPAYEEPRMPAEVRAALGVPVPEDEVVSVPLTSSVASAESDKPKVPAIPAVARRTEPEERAAPTAFVLGPTVPSFRGKSLRSVLAECNRLKVELDYSGSGLARWQYPAAGAALPSGQRVRVVFAR